MEIIHDQFIGIYKNALPPLACDEIIEEFKKLKKFSITRKEEHIKTKENNPNLNLSPKLQFGQREDRLLFLERNNDILASKIKEFLMQNIFPLYADYYGIIEQEFQSSYIDEVKIQKTLPSQGFHVWHCENSHGSSTYNRLLAYTIYLNDIEEGGETEFLYQSKRVKPTKGTICLFPTYFTHTHRGNPPLSGEKYIATGWVKTQINTP